MCFIPDIRMRKNFLIEIWFMKLISRGGFTSSLRTPFHFLLLVILTRKTWARCWNWGHLRGARAAGDTAVHSLHWSHPCSQCPWSSHSNLSHPSLASAPQDTARKERQSKKGRRWERNVERGCGGRHKLGGEKKRGRNIGQHVHFNQDQSVLRRLREQYGKDERGGSGRWDFEKGERDLKEEWKMAIILLDRKQKTCNS